MNSVDNATIVKNFCHLDYKRFSAIFCSSKVHDQSIALQCNNHIVLKSFPNLFMIQQLIQGINVKEFVYKSRFQKFQIFNLLTFIVCIFESISGINENIKDISSIRICKQIGNP